MIKSASAADPLPYGNPTLVRVLRGPAFGIRQPVLIAQILLPLQATANWRETDGNLGKLFGPTLTSAIVSRPGFHGDFAARVLAIADALQQKAGLPVFEKGGVLGFRQDDSKVIVSLALPYAPRCAEPAFDAVLCATRVLWQLLKPEAGNNALVAAREQLDPLLKRMQTMRPQGVNSLRFMRAAHQSGIPWDWAVANFYQFGWGLRQCWLNSTILDTTASMGVTMARDKMACAHILRRAGLPVPDHARATSLEKARRIADHLGYPVVIKPVDLDGGVGVAAGLQTPEQLERAWSEASKHTQKIMVEKHQEGQDFRLLVLDGKMVWAVGRIPGGVTGDGERTIRELVELTNRDPRRSYDAEATLRPLKLDDEALEMISDQGLALDTVLTAGKFACLRRAANISSGGTPVVVNDRVHPDNRRLAERAVALLNLDLAGVDLLIPDIGISWLTSGAAILEINAQPQLVAATQTHLYQQILEARVSHRGRIPVAVFLGDAGIVELARSVGESLHQAGRCVGIASREGLWINGQPVGRKGLPCYEAGKAMLAQRDIGIMLMAGDPSVLKTGLPVDVFDLLVVSEREGLNPAEADWIDKVLRLAVPNCSGLVIGNSLRVEALLKRLQMKVPHVSVANGDATTLARKAHKWLEARIEQDRLTPSP